MAINLRPPAQGIGTTEEKLRSLYSYLFQMTETLNQGLANIEGSAGSAGITKVLSAGSSKKLDKNTADAYQQLKSLIIKTATEVTATTTRIVNEMASEYMASSEYGNYYEYLKKVTEETADGSLTTWDYQEGVVHGEESYKARSNVFIKVGIVKYYDDGTVDAGIIVGRNLHAVEQTIVHEDGTTEQVFCVEGDEVYSVLGPDSLSLWQNGTKLTEVSLSGFFGDKAYINEVTTHLIQSEEDGAALALNKGLLQGVAENIDLQANNSIKLAVSNSLSALSIVNDNLLKLSDVPASGTAYYLARYYFGSEAPKAGDICTVRIWGKVGTGDEPVFAVDVVDAAETSYTFGDAARREDGTFVFTGPWPADNAYTVRIHCVPYSLLTPSSVERIKLEHGDKPTAWIPHREEFKAGTTLELDERGLRMSGGEISMITRDDNNNQTGTVIIDKRGVNATGGEIKMITKDDEGNDTGAVVIDRDGVLATGGRIEMQSIKDGEVVGNVAMDPEGFRAQGVAISLSTGDDDSSEYINITDDGVAASSVSAPNVAVRYDGPSSIWVDSTNPSSYYEDPYYARTLQEVFERLRGKVLDYDVTIALSTSDANIQYGDLRLRGVSGSGKITINTFESSNWKLYGTLGVQFVSVPVYVLAMTIISNTNAISAEHSSVSLLNCNVKLNKNGISGSIGINAVRGSDVVVQNCMITGFGYAYRAANGGTLTSTNSTTDSQVAVSCGILYIMDHTAFVESSWKPSITAGAVYTSGVREIVTSPSTKPDEPMPTTVTAPFTEGKSYSYTGKKWINDGQIRQGLYGSTNYVGCMWFDRSGFSGKTLTSATLTLKRVNNTGRGSAVTLHLYAISATPTGNPTSGFVDCGVIGKIGSGATASFSVLDAAQLLANGTYIGFALFEAGASKMTGQDYSANYCRIDTASPELTVTY